MAGVGEQRHRAGEEAEHTLNHHKAGVERDADQKRPAEIGGRVRMAVPMPMPMSMPMAMSIAVRMSMRLAGLRAMVVAMIASFALLSLSMKTLPLGTAYTIWTGIGAVGAFLVGLFILGEPASLMRVAAAVLIVSGLVMMKLSS